MGVQPPVVPAEAGIQGSVRNPGRVPLDPRVRGGDEQGGSHRAVGGPGEDPPPVIPAEAGIQGPARNPGRVALDPSVPGGDGGERSAAAAFDAIAGDFDARYGGWLSVAAQRRAVRSALASAFPPGARVLEIGGGTGEDALWLARRGRRVLVTDASPAMVEATRAKLGSGGGVEGAQVLPAERIGDLDVPDGSFDGAFSNFAALNCVSDLEPVARGLARLVRPGAPVLLVLFGPLPPGEVVVQLVRGSPRAGFRRLATGEVPARIGGRSFTVRYHRPAAVERAMRPWFRLVERRGIGIFVPPSAAEPWISRHPRPLGALEAMDRVAARPLALLGDHVLFHFARRGFP